MVQKLTESYAIRKQSAQMFDWAIFNLRLLNELEVENNKSEITKSFEDMGT
jgi:hypothetical protein